MTILQEPPLLTAEADWPPEAPGFLTSYPGYAATRVVDELRNAEYGYLDAEGHTYLDYTGAGLPAQAQLRSFAERMQGQCFGNPHSENPTSAASTELVERARCAVLEYFNAPEDEYAVIFTPNASGACRLVGEAYPFGPRTRFVATWDNHNSVNGIREFAKARGASTGYVPFCSPELRVDGEAVRGALSRFRPGAVSAALRVARAGVAPWAGRGLRARRQRSLAQGWVQDPRRSVTCLADGPRAPPRAFRLPGAEQFQAARAGRPRRDGRPRRL